MKFGCCSCGKCFRKIAVKKFTSGGAIDTEWETNLSEIIYGTTLPTQPDNTIPAGGSVWFAFEKTCSNFMVTVEVLEAPFAGLNDSDRGFRIKVGDYLQAWQYLPTAVGSSIDPALPSNNYHTVTLNAGYNVEHVVESDQYTQSDWKTYAFREVDAFGFRIASVMTDQYYDKFTASYNNPDSGNTEEMPWVSPNSYISSSLKVDAGRAGSPDYVWVKIEAGYSPIEIGEVAVWQGTPHQFCAAEQTASQLSQIPILNEAPTTTVANSSDPSVDGVYDWEVIRDPYWKIRELAYVGGWGKCGYFDNTLATASELTELSDMKSFYASYSNYGASPDEILQDHTIFQYIEPKVYGRSVHLGAGSSPTPFIPCINSIWGGGSGSTYDPYEELHQPIITYLTPDVYDDEYQDQIVDKPIELYQAADTIDLSDATKGDIEIDFEYLKLKTFHNWDNGGSHITTTTFSWLHESSPSAPELPYFETGFGRNIATILREPDRGEILVKKDTFAIRSATINGTDYGLIRDTEIETGTTAQVGSWVTDYENEYTVDSTFLGQTHVVLRGRNLLRVFDWAGTDSFYLGFKGAMDTYPDLTLRVDDSSNYEVTFDSTDLYAKFANSRLKRIGEFDVTLTNGSDTVTLRVYQ